jgi:aspartyl-tRNA(Asn)/glutamyl-tRNA(Gln) amidotransferase subunit A
MIAYASSLDQAGPMAKTARDCALLLSAIAKDAKDSTSIIVRREDFTWYGQILVSQTLNSATERA